MMITQCPVCGGLNLSKSDPVATVVRCEQCEAMINEQAYAKLAASSIQELQDTDFYKPGSDDERAEHLEKLAIYDHILDTLAVNGATLRRDGTFLDFGAGCGYAAAAASRRCRHCIICDMHPEVARTVLASLGINNVTVIDDIALTPYKADVLFMWHALEHLPDPTAFWIKNRKTLADRAELIIQVPLYRPDYVVDVHFVLYNEKSLRVWFEKIGGNLRTILIDKENDFITALGNLR
jgi:protein-L-isoaspartate O-methyltransferase